MHRSRQPDDEPIFSGTVAWPHYPRSALDANIYYLPMKLFLLTFPLKLIPPNSGDRGGISFSFISTPSLIKKGYVIHPFYAKSYRSTISSPRTWRETDISTLGLHIIQIKNISS